MNRIKYPLVLPSSSKEEIYTYEVKINNTNISAEDVAEMIKKRFDL